MGRALLDDVDVAQFAVAGDIDRVGIAPQFILVAAVIGCGDKGADVGDSGGAVWRGTLRRRAHYFTAQCNDNANRNAKRFHVRQKLRAARCGSTARMPPLYFFSTFSFSSASALPWVSFSRSPGAGATRSRKAAPSALVANG